MKKQSKGKSSSVPSQAKPDVAGLLNKIQHQLTFLEQKIDTLIGQSLRKPFEGNNFSKPFQHFDHSHRYNKGKQDSDSRERNFTKVVCSDCKKECEVPFRPSGGRPVYCRDCFAKRKDDTSFKGKYNDRPKGRDSIQSRYFDKQPGNQDQRPHKRKKPIFRRRKERP